MLKYRHAERCPSGLRCGSRKSVRAKTCRGFESHPLRFFILCSVTFYGGMRTHKSKTCIGSSARQQRAKCFCAALSVLSKTRSLVYRCRVRQSHLLRFFILCSVTFYGGMRTYKSKTCIGSSARQQRAKCFCAALSVLSKTRSLVYRCRVRQSHPLRFFILCSVTFYGGMRTTRRRLKPKTQTHIVSIE